jgi:hypothetical protein
LLKVALKTIKQTNKQTHKQTNKQTHEHIDTYENTSLILSLDGTFAAIVLYYSLLKWKKK